VPTRSLDHLDKRAPPLFENPLISHRIVAEMVGTTRPQVNLFMNKFRRRGYINHDGRLEVHQSLQLVLQAR
jgi:CRP/FNR family cyclic AMP-dependent transcriptional regulator